MRALLATLALAGALLLAPSARADVGDQWDGLLSTTVSWSAARASARTPDARTGAALRRTARYRAHANGRPVGCPPRLWCGCWAAHYFGITGARARSLWLARNWLHEGRRVARPRPGAVAVFARGGRGGRGGHVGVVTRVVGPGRIVLLSGNDGNRVRERERSTHGVIGYVVL